MRRYGVPTKTCTTFVPAQAQGGPPGSPQYVTFGKTNPSTLAYQH